MILAAIIFYVRKKKRSEKNDREELSVDWDEIEGRFTETSPAGLPQPAGSIIMSQPATSTTAVSPPIASADIIATDTKIHATETNNSNERVLRPDIPQIIKPDIEIPKN